MSLPLLIGELHAASRAPHPLYRSLLVGVILAGFGLLDWLSVVGLVIGVASLAAAVYMWLRPRTPKPLLAWSSETQPVFDKTVEDVNVQYRGQTVERLYLTTLTFVNEGRAPIRADDFARSASGAVLAIVTDGQSRALGATVSAAEYTGAAVIWAVAAGRAHVNIEVLDVSDSFRLGIMHETPDPEFDVVGRLLGGELIDADERLNVRSTWYPRILLAMMAPALVIAWSGTRVGLIVLAGWGAVMQLTSNWMEKRLGYNPVSRRRRRLRDQPDT